MNVALLIQGAFLLAMAPALFVVITSTDTRRRLAAQAAFSILLAGGLLTQTLAFQEHARADVGKNVSRLERLAAAELPSQVKREGQDLATSEIESAVELGLGLPNMLLLIGCGVLLGVAVAQLLALYRSRDRSRPLPPESAA